IRIDDQALMQLQDKRELAVLASDMLARNITYIPLGNASNEMLHQRLLTTIDNRGRFIEGTDLNVALNQAAAMIANGKQADLHVLVAQSGQTDSAMKASVQQLVNELKVQNIFVTPHYYYGTSSSKLQEMYDHIKWNEEKNQYVLFLQT